MPSIGSAGSAAIDRAAHLVHDRRRIAGRADLEPKRIAGAEGGVGVGVREVGPPLWRRLEGVAPVARVGHDADDLHRERIAAVMNLPTALVCGK